jgi:hypothetical protein
MKGRSVTLSRPRRILTDLSHAALGCPRATLLRRIHVGALVGPRLAMPKGRRVAWPVLFAKAYALVAAETPALRRVYVKLPWPHLYELPCSVGSIVVERDWRDATGVAEKALFLARLKDPAGCGLEALAARLRQHKQAPVESIADYRRVLALAALPLPARRLALWLAMNLGRQVPNFLGTFAVSALGAQGAAIVQTIPVWSSFLNYGPIGEDGQVEVFLSVDHRVMDGAQAARAIAEMEAALNGPVLRELRALPGAYRLVRRDEAVQDQPSSLPSR